MIGKESDHHQSEMNCAPRCAMVECPKRKSLLLLPSFRSLSPIFTHLWTTILKMKTILPHSLCIAQCRFESHLPTQPHQLITFRPLPPLLAFSSSRAFKDDWHWRGRGTSSCRRIYFRTPSHPSIESNADKREREKGFKMLDVGRRRRGGRTPTRNRQIDESTVVTGKILCRMFFSPTWVHNISSSSLRLRCWLSICSLRYQGERYERQS